MRPRLPAMLLAPGGLGLRFALCRYRRFFGLRSSSAVSSVASGRIEFVSQPLVGLQFYGLSVHFQLLSTPCRHDAVTFSFWREAPPQRDSHPPVHAHSQAHRSVPAEPLGPPRSKYPPGSAGRFALPPGGDFLPQRRRDAEKTDPIESLSSPRLRASAGDFSLSHVRQSTDECNRSQRSAFSAQRRDR
jgi:hypothetical protein